MYCPKCNGKTKVVDSRKVESGVFRFRKCKCGYSFYTEEYEIEDNEGIKYAWAEIKRRQRRK